MCACRVRVCKSVRLALHRRTCRLCLYPAAALYTQQYNEKYDNTNKGGEYYGNENDGYYNGDQDYYSDAYDR